MEGDDDDGGLARHVWQQYTNSNTDLTKARERHSTPMSLLEMTSEANNIATATEESKTADKKPLGGKVDVTESEDQKSKVLQLRKKPSIDLTGTGTASASKDSEAAGSTLTRMFGSKVNLNVQCWVKYSQSLTQVNSILVILLLLVCLLLYVVLLLMTVKAASCADRLEELQEIANQQRKEWAERIKTSLL